MPHRAPPTLTAAILCAVIGCAHDRGASASEPATDPSAGSSAVEVPIRRCREEWVHLPVVFLFPHLSTEPDAPNRALLGQVADAIRARSDVLSVRVEGHAQPCHGEGEPMVIAQERATRMARVLVERAIPIDRIETIGYGDHRFAECARTDEEAASTRRVELSILVCADPDRSRPPPPFELEVPGGATRADPVPR